jgi:hypothetical protein
LSARAAAIRTHLSVNATPHPATAARTRTMFAVFGVPVSPAKISECGISASPKRIRNARALAKPEPSEN